MVQPRISLTHCYLLSLELNNNRVCERSPISHKNKCLNYVSNVECEYQKKNYSTTIIFAIVGLFKMKMWLFGCGTPYFKYRNWICVNYFFKFRLWPNFTFQKLILFESTHVTSKSRILFTHRSNNRFSISYL